MRSLVYPLSIRERWVWGSASLLSRFALSLCLSLNCWLLFFLLLAISSDYFETLNRELLEQLSLLRPYIQEEREKIKENVSL